MNDADHDAILADEASVERQYRDVLRARALDRPANHVDRNTWTAGQHKEFDRPTDGWIIGRIALDSPAKSIHDHTDFYIGSDHMEIGATEVFSWAAPVSCTYYRKSSQHHQYCAHVVGVRSFAHAGDHLAAFEDEVLNASAPDPLFARETLAIPRASGRGSINSKQAEPGEGSPEEEQSVLVPAPAEVAQAKPEATSGPPLRAGAILRKQLGSPKKVAMSAVLATLQPDQYELITQPYKANEFLQGHPGTGKTIIAVHRAAYLLNDWAAGEARLPLRGRLLVVGPTEEYKAHVSAALRELIEDSNRYSVVSIPELLDLLSGAPNSGEPSRASNYLEVDRRLAELVDEAFKRAKGGLERTKRPTAASVYSELLNFLTDPPHGVLDADWVKFMRSLPPSYDEVIRPRRVELRALLAYIGSRVNRSTGVLAGLSHIIVDEAQDVHQLEWAIMGRIGNSGGWTVLGDLNQRRTDFTDSTWDLIAQDLGIQNDVEKAPVYVLERGYRSTAQIMHFANQLLKKEDRGLISLQRDGSVPELVRATTERDLYPKAVAEAIKLCQRLEGSVAIISMDSRLVNRTLLKLGWGTSSGDASTWKLGEMAVRVLPPDRARGLEFDGVVVVEPAQFPLNFGRQGVLYTALTRANRELVVVNNRALPKELHRP